MKKAFAFVISLSFLVLVLSACNNNVDDMLEDYNGGFKKGHVTISTVGTETILKPGDIGFEPLKMLLEEYFVWEDSTLTLSAPPGCVTVTWVITDPDDENSVVEFYPFGYEDGVSKYNIWRTSLLQIYIPDSGLESNKVYEVTLTVTDKGGNEYKDIAAIVVYKHLYY